ncbi:hypothetical protein NPIL_540191 [Nephila pilipes]|uniref:Uncharacterized protein n=1 Tax=Nephila pilipes TaxID=299642 RepID=A0A8X6N3R2_NEPPI|nr:hypothetical protein NPIL_540191 [Nephila pilipes]
MSQLLGEGRPINKNIFHLFFLSTCFFFSQIPHHELLTILTDGWTGRFLFGSNKTDRTEVEKKIVNLDGDSDEFQRGSEASRRGARVTRGPLISRDSLINWLPCVTRTALLERKFGNDAADALKKKTCQDKWSRNRNGERQQQQKKKKDVNSTTLCGMSEPLKSKRNPISGG